MVLPGNYYHLVLTLVISYFVLAGLAGANFPLRFQSDAGAGKARPVAGFRFVTFALENKWWLLAPAIATISIFAACILFQSSSVAPFIYTLF
jgi:hypothetical protein